MKQHSSITIPSVLSDAPTPDFELADRLISQLTNAHWSNDTETKGMHSYGYTASEQEAIDIVVQEAIQQGMETFSDLAGNIYMVKRGHEGGTKTDVIVSHIDTVEKGGAHDGRDGIVAGLAAVAGLNKAHVTPPHDVCVMIARSEESCINGLVSIGAKAATGNLSTEELAALKNRKTGKTVIKHMDELGIPTATLTGRLDAGPTLFPTGQTAKNLIGFLVEPHIEQGKYCAKYDINVGVVTSIRGSSRFPDAVIHGEAAHSGATFEEDRADAVRAYVKLVGAAENWFDQKKAEGHDIVFTPAKVNTLNKSPTTIANRVDFTLEMRSNEEDLLREFASFIQDKAKEIESSIPNPALKFELPEPIIGKPAVMDNDMVQHAQRIADSQCIKANLITSGAGHDTVQFANTGTPSVMLFIRQHDPISHNPRESRDRDSFNDACRIISGMIMNPPEPMPEHQQGHSRNNGKPHSGSFTDYIREQGAKPYTPGQWRG
jgi:beta-ureidopropionase / N-carbamoyl-L-amino-acid hydrolase